MKKNESVGTTSAVQNDQRDRGALWREALASTSLGWDLAVPIFSGVLLGYYLDRRLGTGHIFTLGLLVLGIGTGFYNVARFIRRLEARERQRAAREDEAGETGWRSHRGCPLA